jgi:aldose 1-epimerase
MGILNDPSALRITAGDLSALFVPARGMLCASLRRGGLETLRRVEDLDAAAARGSTAGIPFLHPWANRLAGLSYRAAGRDVTLDPSSPYLHLDDHGLPMHGVPWALLSWEVKEAGDDRIAARLEWTRRDLLSVFPFPHAVELTVRLRPDYLVVETSLIAAPEGPVPVSFGFHPYFGIAGLERAAWRLELPPMKRLVLDSRGIPTGEEQPHPSYAGPLGGRQFDDGFALIGQDSKFSLAGAGCNITLELLAGYGFAQIFAPLGKELVALEPMTAPTDALTSGRGLTIVPPGERYRAAFQIHVGSPCH